jgi:hypothetical protein
MLNWCQVGYPSMFCLPLILINHQPGELIVQRSNKKHWCKFSFTEFRAISAVILVFKVFFVCEFIKIILFFKKKLLLTISTVQKI